MNGMNVFDTLGSLSPFDETNKTEIFFRRNMTTSRYSDGGEYSNDGVETFSGTRFAEILPFGRNYS